MLSALARPPPQTNKARHAMAEIQYFMMRPFPERRGDGFMVLFHWRAKKGIDAPYRETAVLRKPYRFRSRKRPRSGAFGPAGAPAHQALDCRDDFAACCVLDLILVHSGEQGEEPVG